MSMTKRNTVRIFLITFKHWDNDTKRMVREDVYVGYTERDLKSALQAFKAAVKNHSEEVSKKIQALKVAAHELDIIQVSTCFKGEEAAAVNRMIDKYDTINNGWNTSYRV